MQPIFNQLYVLSFSGSSILFSAMCPGNLWPPALAWYRPKGQRVFQVFLVKLHMTDSSKGIIFIQFKLVMDGETVVLVLLYFDLSLFFHVFASTFKKNKNLPKTNSD